jgi:hypothetical protein
VIGLNRKKLIYSILKELETGQEPKQSDYDLDLDSWGELAELIRDEELAKNVVIQRGGMGNKVVYAWYSSAKITLKGLDFLEENSVLSKTYKGLKEVREWIKL